MKVIVNDEDVEVLDQASLNQVLQQLNIRIKSGIAMAVNDEVVSRHCWDDHRLSPNDKILLIHTIAGG